MKFNLDACITTFNNTFSKHHYNFMWIVNLFLAISSVYMIVKIWTKPDVERTNMSVWDMRLDTFRQSLVSSNVPKDIITKAIQGVKVEEHLTPNRDHVIIDWFDWKPSKNQSPNLALILIPSRAEAVKERKVIRETWGAWAKNYDMKYVFYVGLPEAGDLHQLFTESEIYQDMVVDHFEDGFFRKSLKVLRGFDWFVQRYRQLSQPLIKRYDWASDSPKFLIKADPDMFLHIPNLRDWLSTKDEKQEIIYGAVHEKVMPDRDPKSRFYCPELLYPKEYYPTFVGGSMYILPSIVLPKILESSLHAPLFHLEDVYITGLLASPLTLQNLPQNRYEEKPKRVQNSIQKRNNVWTCLGFHAQSDDVIRFLFNVANRKLNPGRFEWPK